MPGDAWNLWPNGVSKRAYAGVLSDSEIACEIKEE